LRIYNLKSEIIETYWPGWITLIILDGFILKVTIQELVLGLIC